MNTLISGQFTEVHFAISQLINSPPRGKDVLLWLLERTLGFSQELIVDFGGIVTDLLVGRETALTIHDAMSDDGGTHLGRLLAKAGAPFRPAGFARSHGDFCVQSFIWVGKSGIVPPDKCPKIIWPLFANRPNFKEVQFVSRMH